MSKKGLGRGLQALIPPPVKPEKEIIEKGITEVSLSKVVVNPDQPRKRFDQLKLQGLAESIKVHGVVQPIVVRKRDKDYFEIVAGERRYRASVMAGMDTIPVIIKDCSSEQRAELALLENIQRENLDPIEEANAYRDLLERHSFTQETLAERLGKSRPYISNLLRLLSLPFQVQSYLSEGKLSVGHAKVLLAIEDRSLLALAVEKVVRAGYSVRETEKLVKSILDKTQPEEVSKPQQNKIAADPLLIQLEDRLRSLLRTQVKIKANGTRGKIEIEYYTQEELGQIIDTLVGELN